MELVVVELDISAELDATECAEIAGAKLIGGTDLGSGRGRWMERNRDGRREYRRGACGSGGGGVGERLRLGRRRRAARARAGAAHAKFALRPRAETDSTEWHERRGRVDED
jgi:hypothetical protein